MIERDNVNPVTQQWNLTVEQQIGNQWMTRASYVGAQTRHIYFTREDINRPDVQRPNAPLQAQRPYQPWGEIDDTKTSDPKTRTGAIFEVLAPNSPPNATVNQWHYLVIRAEGRQIRRLGIRAAW